MRKQILFVLLVILINCSCQNNTRVQKIVDDFPESIELKGEQFFEDSFQLATVQHFDSLIVLTADMENFFHVFTKDGKLVTSFGREGKGPGEFLRVPFLTDSYKQDSTTYGVVYDEILNKSVIINFTASVTENELIVKDTPKLPTKINKSSLLEYLYIRENNYTGMLEDRLAQQINQQRNGFYYDAAQDEFTILPLHNLKIQPHEKLPEINLNNRKARISPDRNKLAFAMMYYPMVEIFEIGSDKPVQYLLDSDPPEGPFELSDYKENKLTKYFHNLYVTDKYLYLLGSRKSKNNDLDKDQEIFVMDWEGNPKEKYLVPDKFDLSWITVDEKNKHIYGISYTHEEAYLFDYNDIQK